MMLHLDPDFTPQWLQSGALLGIPNAESSGVELLLGIQQVEKPKDNESTRFYAPEFFEPAGESTLFYQTYRRIQSSELNLDEPQDYPSGLKWSVASKVSFADAFGSLQLEFKKGSLQKGVPYVFEEAPLASADTLAFRKKALGAILRYAHNRPVIPYGFWNERQMLLGCTPETLFRKEGHQVTTMALAGTRRHKDETQLSLLEDPKERREHRLVIDFITDELAHLGKVSVAATEVIELPQLSHLKTEITLASLATSSARFEDLVRALHPTPALGAMPREQGLTWLKQMEVLNRKSRKRFGAPFGASWNNGESALAVVAIRNLQWENNQLLLCAGCGVIAESDFEKEWQELQGKIRAVKGIFEL